MYNKINFYEPLNEERYRQYSIRFPDMATDEVVWRVNNSLDFEKYTHDIPVTDGDDILVIVNKYFKLPSDYVPKDLVVVDGMEVNKIAAEAYIKMRDAAKAEGFTIKGVSAYRSIEEQRELYDKHLACETVDQADSVCARAGYSEHHTGLAIDIRGSFGRAWDFDKTPEAPWIFDNCHRFGFIVRYLPETTEITGYASEPWHLRYIGVKASSDMKSKGIKSFEEYKERFLKNK